MGRQGGIARSFARALIGVVVIASFTGGVTDTASAASTVRGVIREAAYVSPAGGDTHAFVLETPSGVTYTLTGPRAHDAEALVGRTVAVTGTKSASSISVTKMEAVAEERASLAAAPSATGTRQARVAVLAFSGGTPAYTVEQARGIVFSNANSLKAFWLAESNGALTLAEKSVEALVLPATWKRPDGVTVQFNARSCNVWDFRAYLDARYGGESYDHMLVAFPALTNPDCSWWGGLGEVPGRVMLFQGAWFGNPLVLQHEAGHNLGFGHANVIDCVEDGVRVAMGGACAPPDPAQHDPFDSVGWGYCTYSPWRRELVGWPASIQTITTSGIYTVRASDLTPDGTTTALRIARPADERGNSYVLEWHAQDFPNCASSEPTTPGLLVRVAPDSTNAAETWLVDTTPATVRWDDAQLTTGRLFTDTANGIAVTVNSIGATTASISVTIGGTPPPTGGTAEVVGGVLRYTTRPGETNSVQVAATGTKTTLGDAVNVTPGSGCARFSDKVVHCESSGITSIVVDLSDGNDTARSRTPIATTFRGGPGDDVFKADATVDGPTTYKGNGGSDRVEYTARTTGVTVKLDTEAGDGAAGEHDLVGRDVETVVGGAGNDTLRGTNKPNTFDGGLGNDVLIGKGGADTLLGSWGNDDLQARDSAPDTRIDCGAGFDTAMLDADDPRTACEHLTP